MSDTDASSADAAMASETSGHRLSGGVVFLIIVASVCVAALVGWRLRNLRYWRERARSAKVLDEIEMEFVNDDAELFGVDEDNDLRIRGGTSTWGPSERSAPL